jgi:4-aminobutyrate aminotransferase
MTVCDHGREADWVRRDAEVFFHQSGSSPCLAALRGASGIWLETVDERRLIDLHGNTAHHLGHAHPRLLAALKAQLDALSFCPRRYTNEPATLLAEALTDRWPGGRAKVLFATGGSDAIEIALRLARVNTGRHETISLEGSYHGHGFGAFGLSRSRLDGRLGPHLAGRHHVTPYWDEAGGGAERTAEDVRRALAASAGGIAAVVAEPIRSNCHVPPAWLWPEVRRLCDAAGALLIFDEIPSGLGKTGRFFAFEHFGAVPDAVVLGKALGGSVAPIAAVIADARLDVAPELDLGHYTHEKNPFITRAALTTLQIIDEDKLVERAARRGAYALRAMETLAGRNPLVGGGRGLGLQLALELRGASDASIPDLASAVVAAALEEGVSTAAKHDAIGFSPPLVIEEAEIDLALDRIERALRTSERTVARRPPERGPR